MSEVQHKPVRGESGISRPEWKVRTGCFNNYHLWTVMEMNRNERAGRGRVPGPRPPVVAETQVVRP